MPVRALQFLTRSLGWGGAALLVASFVLYPGGTWWERAAVGASLLDTFLCDLMADPAIDGRANAVGATLGRVGLGLVAASIAPTWELFRRAPRGLKPRLASVAGLLGLLGLPLLAWALLTPGSSQHAPAIALAAVAETAALTLAALVAPSARGGGLPLRVSAGLLLVFIVIGTLLYVPTLLDHTALAQRGLPAVQKASVSLLLVFEFAVVRISSR